MCDCTIVDPKDLKPGDVYHFDDEDEPCSPLGWYVVVTGAVKYRSDDKAGGIHDDLYGKVGVIDIKLNETDPPFANFLPHQLPNNEKIKLVRPERLS